MLRLLPLLLIAPALALSACAEPRAAAQTSPAALPALVRTAPIEVGNAPPVRAVGMLAGKGEIRLSFKNGGTVERLRVEAGASVRRGEILGALNQTEISSQLAQAVSAADKASLDFDRVDHLRRQGTVAQASYDEAKTALDVARGSVAIARYNETGTALVAPEDGVIERRLAEVGEIVGPGQAVYTLREARRGLVLRVGLTDKDVQQVHVGTAGRVRFSALAKQPFAGTVTEIASSASPLTGTFEAEVRIDAPDPRLLPGLVGSAELDRTSAPVTWLPIEALADPNGLAASVYTLVEPANGAPPRVERRAVEIAYLEEARVAIVSSLVGATRVVTDGLASCEPGATVRLAP
jgi:multidrug efflux system membrane fusion protein